MLFLIAKLGLIYVWKEDNTIEQINLTEYFSLKLSGTSYNYLKNGNNVAFFNDVSKNVSGYAGSKAIKNVPKSLLFGEERIGRGSIVYMVDNPLFRSFWENGKLFVANSVFLLNSNKLK